MDECTCWLPFNPVSHVVIILTLCFTAHTTLSPSSLYHNNLTDGCIEPLCTLIMSVKSLTSLVSVPPQLHSTPAVCVLWGSMHVAQCSAYWPTPPHGTQCSVCCVVEWVSIHYMCTDHECSEHWPTALWTLFSQAI